MQALRQRAPIGVANFVGLATGTKTFRNPATHAEVRGKHFYDGLTFGRVIPDFMVQNADSPGDPTGGGAGYKFSNEIVPGFSFYRRRRLAYANSGPDTNSSEFFPTEHPIHRLDGNSRFSASAMTHRSRSWKASPALRAETTETIRSSRSVSRVSR